MKYITIFILIFLCLIPISSCESIIFKNDLCINQIDNIIVYENDIYKGIYNYTQDIPYNNTSEYIFVINNDAIDIINSEGFLINIFNNYGYVIVSLFGLIMLISIGIYFYKKAKK